MKTLITAIAKMLSGCAGMSDRVTTTITDTAENVTTTIASANVQKHANLYRMQSDIDKQYTEQKSNAGFGTVVTGINNSPLTVKRRWMFLPSPAIHNLGPGNLATTDIHLSDR